MQTREHRTFNRLYFQVSAIFILVLTLFTAVTLYISVNAATDYATEVNQKLNRDLARNMVDQIRPEFRNGEVNDDAIQDMVHSMMVVNPSIEIYLLDTAGNILSYVAPEKVVKLDRVSLDPVYSFLNDPGNSIVYGDDPRNPGEKKTFSAARVTEEGRLTGYIYIVLASQEYVSASHRVIGSYILGYSTKSVVLILIVSTAVGLVAIWYITNKLNKIIAGIKSFQAGNLNTRIPVQSDGELDRIGIVFNDMAGEIERNIEKLKGIDELRKELISNVSHDLRTPVASIQGYAETLMLKADHLTQEEQRKYAGIIYQSCERLRRLVDELFELSKLEANQVQLKKEKFSVAELASDIANKFRLISGKKGVSINTFISKDIPSIEADISLIDRVLQNLIDNAIRFCHEGDAINIEISLSNPGHVRISISDTGEGISQEELPNIFERFYKGSRSDESTGLGLAIVKKIIDLHKTSIDVKSIPGQGTTFAFELPAVLAA